MAAFTPEDIYRLLALSDVRISPDGTKAVFCETGMDPINNEYTSRIWAITGDGDATPFSPGASRESKPRFSPDGTKIAYVAHPDEKGAALVVAGVTDGHLQTITETVEDIEDIAWSPDGRCIAFTSRDRDEQLHGPDKPKDQAPKRIENLVYRLDSVGWTVGRTRQVHVIGLEEQEPRKLTSMPTDVGFVAWSPDSRTIVTSSADHPTWDRDYKHDLFAVSIDGSAVERLTPNDGSYAMPSFDGHGSRLAFLFTPEPLRGPFHPRVGVLEMSSGRIELLTEDLDRNCGPYTMHREPVWVGETVYFTVEDRGCVHLYRIDMAGDAKPELVVGGKRMISSFDIGPGWIAAISTSPTEVSFLEAIDLDGGEPRQLHSPWRASLGDVELREPEGFTAISPDGTEVQAWVMTPPDFDPDKHYPMVLNIHGGPFTQYGEKFFDEFQVYAAAGYVVVYANPRGSSGYSEAFGRAIKGRKTDDPGSGWGARDMEDLLAAVDTACDLYPFIDPERIGVMGGSYGGYMTSWLVGQTQRFKAAISERAVNSMYTMAYTSDMAAYFGFELGPLYLDDPEEYKRVSPITYVKNIHTPLLIMHSENDLRCPIEQAEQMFMALKHLGREVEFVRFPGESHELSRSGAPRHRVQRFEIVLDWLARKL